MTLEQAIKMIVEAKSMDLCYASEERKERFLDAVTKALIAHGDAKWDQAIEATIRVLKNGGTVSGLSCNLKG